MNKIRVFAFLLIIVSGVLVFNKGAKAAFGDVFWDRSIGSSGIVQDMQVYNGYVYVLGGDNAGNWFVKKINSQTGTVELTKNIANVGNIYTYEGVNNYRFPHSLFVDGNGVYFSGNIGGGSLMVGKLSHSGLSTLWTKTVSGSYNAGSIKVSGGLVYLFYKQTFANYTSNLGYMTISDATQAVSAGTVFSTIGNNNNNFLWKEADSDGVFVSYYESYSGGTNALVQCFKKITPGGWLKCDYPYPFKKEPGRIVATNTSFPRQFAALDSSTGNEIVSEVRILPGGFYPQVMDNGNNLFSAVAPCTDYICDSINLKMVDLANPSTLKNSISIPSITYFDDYLHYNVDFIDNDGLYFLMGNFNEGGHLYKLDVYDDNANCTATPVSSPKNASSSFSATITCTNTGSTTWDAAQGYRLGSQNLANNIIWGVSSINFPVGTTTVIPGQQVIFTGNFTAPSIAGTYNYQWQMTKGATFFGAMTELQSILVQSCLYSNHICYKSSSIDCGLASKCGQTGTETAACLAFNSCTGATESRPLSECGASCVSGSAVQCPICSSGGFGTGEWREVTP